MPQDSLPHSASPQWFYHLNDQTQGPVPTLELKRLLKDGRISKDTLIAQEGAAEWQALFSVFPDWLGSTPPALPPLPSKPSMAAGAEKPKPSTKDTVIGCCGLIVLAVVCIVMLGKCLGGGGEDEKKVSASKPAASGSSPSHQKLPALTPARREEFRKELIGLYERLEEGLTRLEARDVNERKWMRDVWAKRVIAIRDECQAAGEITLGGAAGMIQSLWMAYPDTEGKQRGSIRNSKKNLADQLEEPSIFTLRHRDEFDFILDGRQEEFFGRVSVVNLADMIEGAVGNRIPWHIVESGLFAGNAVDARLIRYDEEYLFYQTETSAGTPLIFALKRTSDIEGPVAKQYPNPSKLYDELIAGQSLENDPLRRGFVLLTSAYTWSDTKPKKEIMRVNVIRLIK